MSLFDRVSRPRSSEGGLQTRVQGWRRIRPRPSEVKHSLVADDASSVVDVRFLATAAPPALRGRPSPSTPARRMPTASLRRIARGQEEHHEEESQKGRQEEVTSRGSSDLSLEATRNDEKGGGLRLNPHAAPYFFPGPPCAALTPSPVPPPLRLPSPEACAVRRPPPTAASRRWRHTLCCSA